MRPSIPVAWVPQQTGLGRSQFSFEQGLKTMQHFTATLYLDPAPPCWGYGSLVKFLLPGQEGPSSDHYCLYRKPSRAFVQSQLWRGWERRNPRAFWPVNPGTKPKMLRCWLPSCSCYWDLNFCGLVWRMTLLADEKAIERVLVSQLLS